MAIFNENGGLISVGATAGGNSMFSDSPNFSKIDGLIEGIYWETKGEFECLSSLCEAGKISGLVENIKSLVGKALRKLAELWSNAVNAISDFAKGLPFKGKEKQIKAAYNSYSLGKGTLKMSEKTKGKLENYIAEYKKLPNMSVKDAATKSGEAVKKYIAITKSSAYPRTEATSGKSKFATDIGSAIGVSGLNTEEGYRKQIDDLFAAEGGKFDIGNVYDAAANVDKSLTECKNTEKTIKNLEKDISGLAIELEDDNDPLVQGCRYGVLVLTYFNGKAMDFIKKKMSLSAKICTQLLHTKGGDERDTENDNFASGPNDDETNE